LIQHGQKNEKLKELGTKQLVRKQAKEEAEQTLHTDSHSSSLSLVGMLAGELSVRRLTVKY
jgi:hypothetical protein